jgi:catalase
VTYGRRSPAASYRFNPFDITKVWSQRDYPPIPVGRMVLGRMFTYGDSARYRIGPNYDQLPINRPVSEAHKDDDDFVQAGTLYRQVMTPTDRDHLAGNIVWHLSQGVERFIQGGQRSPLKGHITPLA